MTVVMHVFNPLALDCFVFSCVSEMRQEPAVQLYAIDEKKTLKPFPTVRFSGVRGSGDMPTEGQLTVESDREIIRTEVQDYMKVAFGHRMCGVAVEAAQACDGRESLPTIDLAGKMLDEQHVTTLLGALKDAKAGLGHTQVIDLSDNFISDPAAHAELASGLAALRRSGELHMLSTVVLDNNRLSERAKCDLATALALASIDALV